MFFILSFSTSIFLYNVGFLRLLTNYHTRISILSFLYTFGLFPLLLSIV